MKKKLIKKISKYLPSTLQIPTFSKQNKSNNFRFLQQRYLAKKRSNKTSTMQAHACHRCRRSNETLTIQAPHRCRCTRDTEWIKQITLYISVIYFSLSSESESTKFGVYMMSLWWGHRMNRLNRLYRTLHLFNTKYFTYSFDNWLHLFLRQ